MTGTKTIKQVAKIMSRIEQTEAVIVAGGQQVDKSIFPINQLDKRDLASVTNRCLAAIFKI